MSGEVEGAVVADEDDEEGHWPSRDGHGLFKSLDLLCLLGSISIRYL